MQMRKRHSGLTLTELVVTVAIAAVLMALAVPAAKRLTETLRDSAGARALIDAALSNARAMAVRTGKDAGIRFQRAANGRTYMVFIVYDYEKTGLANGFCAIDGRKPIPLPEDLGVVDEYRVDRAGTAPADITLSDPIGNIDYLSSPAFEDTSTFSIVFSPAGNIVTRLVQVRQRAANDPVFNIQGSGGMFLQDDYNALGIGLENSRRQFRIYDKKNLAAVNPASRWSAYLRLLNPLMVSPYTGELIGE